ncbi:hypothetical protein PIB30_083809 [Stylosanthes scabra]|uniref:Uncharacterized protein n=1 Tax=Stylosanthes scabra TaxID=79078 RepID=A0ABU6WQM1_9FABA|nr:hypothetical protein [Stylosanthes scabra]
MLLGSLSGDELGCGVATSPSLAVTPSLVTHKTRRFLVDVLTGKIEQPHLRFLPVLGNFLGHHYIQQILRGKFH